jgi:hypothetical protein
LFVIDEFMSDEIKGQKHQRIAGRSNHLGRKASRRFGWKSKVASAVPTTGAITLS